MVPQGYPYMQYPLGVPIAGYHAKMNRNVASAGVGMRLRAAREALSLSRAQLSQKTGVAEGTIVKAESRASAPESDTLLKLARTLGADPWYLTFGEAMPQMSPSEIAETAEHLTVAEGPIAEALRVIQHQLDQMVQDGARMLDRLAVLEAKEPKQKPTARRSA